MNGRGPSDEEIADVIEALAHVRGAERSFCPSEAARRLAADWRPLMPRVRAVAGDLVDAGRLVATRKGEVVDPRTARGPIRLGRAGSPEA